MKNCDFYSTAAERRNCTPKESSKRGAWNGIRGFSKFIPANDQILVRYLLKQFNLSGIHYYNYSPDFEPCSIVKILLQCMSSNRSETHKQCNQLCADYWNHIKYLGRNDWTSSQVKKYCQENDLTWHECNDRSTCLLVPTAIHAFFGHLGGIAECKRAEKLKYHEK